MTNDDYRELRSAIDAMRRNPLHVPGTELYDRIEDVARLLDERDGMAEVFAIVRRWPSRWIGKW